MGILDRLRGAPERRAVAVQTARGDDLRFGFMDYTPLSPPDAGLIDAMREAIPVIDAALDKIVRLAVGFRVECSDPGLQPKLDEFVSRVRVGAAGQGLHQFVGGYLHSLLTYGNAVGEIIPTADGRDVYALYNARLRDVHIRRGEGPLDVQLCTLSEGKMVAVPYSNLVMFTPLNPSAGDLLGQPLLRGLPFLSRVLVRIFESIGKNFERVGNLRYAVTYNPGDDRLDKAQAGEIAALVAREWAGAMKSGEEVRDFVAVGDVDIKVIGADNQMIDSQVPVRQCLEQIVAKLGIPPFMLGLSWSTTERMSAQQADILTSELESYRRLLEPVIRRVCDTYLMLNGFAAAALPVWDDINLQDEVELASIRLTNARAALLEKQAALQTM